MAVSPGQLCTTASEAYKNLDASRKMDSSPASGGTVL